MSAKAKSTIPENNYSSIRGVMIYCDDVQDIAISSSVDLDEFAEGDKLDKLLMDCSIHQNDASILCHSMTSEQPIYERSIRAERSKSMRESLSSSVKSFLSGIFSVRSGRYN